MRIITFIIPLLLASFVFADEKVSNTSNAHYMAELLNDIKSHNQLNELIYKDRESQFKRDLLDINNELSENTSKLKNTKIESNRLKTLFEKNETVLAELDNDLKKSLGNLGEMFGVVRQVAQDVISTRESSLLKTKLSSGSKTLNQLAESKALPNISELEALWFEMQSQMTMQSEIARIKSPYIDVDGNEKTESIVHIGPFNAINENGYLNYDIDSGLFFELGRQPSSASYAVDFYHGGSNTFTKISIDPTRGTLLSLSSQSPSMIERVHQGGVIGYVILVLAFLGVSFGLVLLVKKLQVSTQVTQQLKDIENPLQTNPLGRVLSVYSSEKEVSDLETLEMKLDEAVLKELPDIERGQSLIKLLAAVAPLLGLLGTVTGMIATFQSITLFGTGDPKLMASGISQALITTVLGLVAAIPLLFVHNLIASRSKSLVQILTQQSAGMIAEQAQKSTH